MTDERKTIDTDPYGVGMFAVVRHAQGNRRASFSVLHDTYAKASAEAIRLLTESVSGHPDRQQTFYVVKIGAFFSGGPLGLISSESVE